MNKPWVLSLVLVLLVVVWMASGSSPEEEQVVSEDKATARLFSVQTQWYEAQDVNEEIRLQGTILPDQVAAISAEVTGSVRTLHVERGAVVKKGDALVTLEIGDRGASLVQAQADVQLYKSELQASKRLLEKKLISPNQFKEKEALLAAARASLQRAQESMSDTVIYAPFDGVVNELAVENGEFVDIGQHVATVVDNQAAIISAVVPQRHIDSVSLGMPVRALTIGRLTYSGTLSYIATTADRGTRTFEIEAKIDNLKDKLYAGVSTRVIIDIAQHKGHKVSPSLLSLATNGDLLVKAVGLDNRVVTYPVEVLRSELNGVWLLGLPEKVNLITLGHGFVTEGEQVASIPLGDSKQFTAEEKTVVGDGV